MSHYDLYVASKPNSINYENWHVCNRNDKYIDGMEEGGAKL